MSWLIAATRASGIDVHSDLMDEAHAGLDDRTLSQMLQPFSSVDRQKLVVRVQTVTRKQR